MKEKQITNLPQAKVRVDIQFTPENIRLGINLECMYFQCKILSVTTSSLKPKPRAGEASVWSKCLGREASPTDWMFTIYLARSSCGLQHPYNKHCESRCISLILQVKKLIFEMDKKFAACHRNQTISLRPIYLMICLPPHLFASFSFLVFLLPLGRPKSSSKGLFC